MQRKKKLKCRFILGSTFVVIGRPEKLPVDERTKCESVSPAKAIVRSSSAAVDVNVKFEGDP